MDMVMSMAMNRPMLLEDGKAPGGSSQQQQQQLEAAAGGLPNLKKSTTIAMKSSSSSSSSRQPMVTEQMRHWVRRVLVSSRVQPCTVAEEATTQPKKMRKRLRKTMVGMAAKLRVVGNGAAG
jgi:hypothetical protein